MVARVTPPPPAPSTDLDTSHILHPPSPPAQAHQGAGRLLRLHAGGGLPRARGAPGRQPHLLLARPRRRAALHAVRLVGLNAADSLCLFMLSCCWAHHHPKSPTPRFETRHMERVVDIVKSNRLHHSINTMGCTGGGAYKFSEMFQVRTRRGVSLSMRVWVGGCLFLLPDLVTESHYPLPHTPNRTTERRSGWASRCGRWTSWSA